MKITLTQKAVTVWRLRYTAYAAGAAFLCGGIAAFYVPLAAAIGSTAFFTYLFGLCYYAPAKGKHIRCAVHNRGVFLNYGVFFRCERALPFHRIQYIEIRRSPAQRLMGLCNLVLHAAGAKVCLAQITLRQGIRYRAVAERRMVRHD
jgi:membrane protein YdbS with pleckstrin-like domain